MLDYVTQIKPYLDLNGAKPPKDFILPNGEPMLHPFLEQIIAQEKELEELFAKEQPAFMQVNRPNESDLHKKYRKDIFKNVVKPFVGRVARQYELISTAEDYEVEFPKVDGELNSEINLRKLVESKIFAGETLETFFWSKWRNFFLMKPNGVAILMPEPPSTELERPKLKAMWVRGSNVWQHCKGEFAVIESEEKSNYIDQRDKRAIQKTDGKILLFFDNESYCVAKQKAITDQGGQWEVLGVETIQNEFGTLQTFNFPLHNCGALPIVVAGSTVAAIDEGGEYEMMSSILEDAVPRLKKALQRDEDGEIVALHHAVPREWEYAPKPCPTCNGVGTVSTFDEEGNEEKIKCPTCKGVGYQNTKNGIGTYMLTAPTVEGYDDQMRVITLPTPPMGRVDGDTAALKAFEESCERQITLAYRDLGMEHLNHIPISQSGVAKRYDGKEGEMNIVTAGMAAAPKLTHLFACASCIVFQRKIEEQMPTVRTPLRLDIEGVEILSQRLTEAIEKGFSPESIYTLQLKYLGVVAGKDSDEYRTYQLRKRVDPYWSFTVETLNLELTQAFQFMDRKSEAFQRKIELIEMSKNFEMLVQEAVASDEAFWSKKPTEQRAKLLEINKVYVSARTDNLEIQPATMRSTVNIQDTQQLQQQN